MRCLKLNDNLLTGSDCLQDLFKIKKDQYFSDAFKSFGWLIKKLDNSSSSLLKEVAKTYEKWKIEICNAYSLHIGFNNISNSIAECSNNKIKTIIKAAYGYNNFERFRKRAIMLLRW